MESVGSETSGEYLHLLVAHVPKQIRMVGDIVAFQTQGLEHLHSIRKRDLRRMSNRKKGQRNTQVGKIQTVRYALQRHRDCPDGKQERKRKDKSHALRKAGLKRKYASINSTSSSSSSAT